MDKIYVIGHLLNKVFFNDTCFYIVLFLLSYFSNLAKFNKKIYVTFVFVKLKTPIPEGEADCACTPTELPVVAKLLPNTARPLGE